MSVLLPLVMLVFTGCGGGDSGPARVHLKGTATFGGQPIPVGEISFIPDSGKGNNGPAEGAAIKDGVYTTESGKGTIGGPHIVRISGFDGKADMSNELPYGEALFIEFEIEAELPAADGESEGQTFNIEVPADAANPASRPKGQASDGV
jgi:hypothetical protein